MPSLIYVLADICFPTHNVKYIPFLLLKKLFRDKNFLFSAGEDKKNSKEFLK